MKKFLSMMLAVLMLLSMATVALADEEQQPTNTEVSNGGTFTLKKVYTGSEYAPKETFKFTATPNSGNPTADGFTDTVTVTHDPDTASTGSYGTVTVQLPTYKRVGTYNYTITEAEGKTEGVSYDSNTYTLSVLVINGTSGLTCQVYMKNGTSKTDTITNEYKYGTLDISKVATSYFDADMSVEYSMQLNLSNVNNVTYTGKYYTLDSNNAKTYGSEMVNLQKGNNTFTLTNGQHFEIVGLPAGASYTVMETATLTTQQNHNGFAAASYTGETGTITAAGTSNAVVTNTYSYTGTLKLSKIVDGAFGDKGNDMFTFTVTGLKKDNITSQTNDVTATDTNAGVTITMKDSGNVTFGDLPYGTEYTVTETSATNYETKYTFVEKYADDRNANDPTTTASATYTGSIEHAAAELTFTNTNTTDVPTGVSLDSLPYVLMLALAGAGLVLMIARKRRVED